MKHYINILITAFLLLCATISAQTEEDVVYGKLRIKLKQEVLHEVSGLKSASMGTSDQLLGLESIDDLNKQMGITRIQRVIPFSVKHEKKHREYGFHLWFELDFDQQTSPNALLEFYSSLDEVAMAVPLYKKVTSQGKAFPINIDSIMSKGKVVSGKNAHGLKSTAAVEFNDPLLHQQWHYENDGTIGTANVDIDLTKAWAKEVGQSNVIVAVIDGGVDTNHEDLKDNLWVNEAELNGEEGVDDDQNGYVDDIHGVNFVMGGPVTGDVHGTHVAGTVGAVSNNGIGVAGVAGGDGSGDNGVRIMSCQVYDDRVGGSGDFEAALIYSADNGAVISQNSWGYTSPGYFDPLVYDAIKYFIAEAGQYEGSPMKGGVVFFAAGNSASDHEHYPGAFPEVVAVASTGPTGDRAAYSNYADWVDISAPGGDKTYGNEGMVLSTLPGNDYGFLQGTSMACPHASGVAALMVSRFGNSSYTPDDLIRNMYNSATPFTFDHKDKMGVGNLNALNVLSEDLQLPPDPIDDLRAIDVFHNQVRIGWTVPADEDDFQPVAYRLAVSSEPITVRNFEEQSLIQFNSIFEAGSEVEVTLSGFSKLTDYYFAIKSLDRYENISEISNILKVTTSDAPKFRESTRYVEVDLDVTASRVVRKMLQFSNVGEGVVYWNSQTVNETEYWRDQVEEIQKELLEEQAQQAAILSLADTEQAPQMGLKSTSIASDNFDHWKNDRTVFRDGFDYNNEWGRLSLVGSGNPNVGLIFATRFNAPMNITHIECMMALTQKEKPVVIELKKGETLEDAQMVYMQKYYSDTTNVIMNRRIPLYQPQIMREKETYWVVLHFPKEEFQPLVIQESTYIPDTFFASNDYGQSYIPAWKVIGPKVPVLSVLSSGENGANTFIDPVNGSIKAGEIMDVELIVDAQTLKNGKHLSSLSVVTSDVFRPGINIDVMINVSGQTAKAKVENVYKFQGGTDIDDKNTYAIENAGLDTLKVYDLNFSLSEFQKDFADTIMVLPGQIAEIPFVFNTEMPGAFSETATLVSNVGDVDLITEMIAYESPSISATLNATTVSVQAGQQATIDLSITNTGNGNELNYDLSANYLPHMAGGKLTTKLNYKIRSSFDAVDPLEYAWDDIESYANRYPMAQIWTKPLDFQQAVPFFDKMTDIAVSGISGNISFFGAISGTTMLYGLKLNGADNRIENFYHYSFGDREVFTVEAKAVSSSYKELEGLKTKYQMVIFRDGTIEYRYKDVEQLLNEENAVYEVGMIGSTLNDSVYFKHYNDTHVITNNSVVRFEPTNRSSAIGVERSVKSKVARGQSVSIPVTVQPDVLLLGNGVYKDTLMIESDAKEGIQKLPLSITVTGTGNFSAADTLDFEDVHIGQTATKYLSVYNDAYGSGDISSIVFTHADFTSNISYPLSIAGLSEKRIPVHYRPVAAGELESMATINFSNGQSKVVRLLARADIDPDFDLTITLPVSATVKAGETVRVPFKLTNTNDQVNLEYFFKNSAIGHVYGANVHPGAGRNEDAIVDDYGYKWEDSDDRLNFFKWKDIKETGTLIEPSHARATIVALPFQFPYYGELYDTVYVSKNGYLAVNQPMDDLTTIIFKKDDGISGTIAPFMTQLTPDRVNGGVYVCKEEDRVYFQWEQHSGDAGSGGKVTFQAEIVDDGSIYFHYKDIEQWSGIMVYGIESPDEEEMVVIDKSYIMNWATIADSTSVALTAPTQNVLSPNEEIDLELELSAEAFYMPGNYVDTIVMATNSQAQEWVEIPVELNVTSGSKTLLVNDTIDYGEVILEPACSKETLISLKNEGHGILEVTNLVSSNIGKIDLYDAEGNKFEVNFGGRLVPSIKINPWETFVVRAVAFFEELGAVDDEWIWKGTMDDTRTVVSANIVETPLFAWSAEDQTLKALESEEEAYQFVIENKGVTSLRYELSPAVKPALALGEYPGIIDEKGVTSLEAPVIVDEMKVDHYDDEADGYFQSMTGHSRFYECTEYTAPEEGFYLTHVKSNTIIKEVNSRVLIRIWVGGDQPGVGINQEFEEDVIGDRGELALEQYFTVTEVINKEWVYYKLKEPISIPPNETFFITILPPSSQPGYDTAGPDDDEMFDKSWVGINRWYVYEDGKPITEQSDSVIYWQKYPIMKQMWKIRPVTAGGEGQWLTLDQMTGEIGANGADTITAVIKPQFASKGEHIGTVTVNSNDINYPKDLFNINLQVNGQPVFTYRPNEYADTLNILELDVKEYNYYFTDHEGEDLLFELTNTYGDSIDISYEQVSNELAKIRLETGYESSGLYELDITLTDASGNRTKDVLRIQVNDVNRAPVLKPGFEEFFLYMGNPEGITIDVKDLFTDPDGDELRILSGNYTPAVYDLALGYRYITMHPLQTGVGFIVFGADDGKPNGFSIYGSYVYVLDGESGDEQNMFDYEPESGELAVSPNPVESGSTSVSFSLEEKAHISCELYSMSGIKVKTLFNETLDKGNVVKFVNVNGLAPGVYTIVIHIDGKTKMTERLVIVG
ncbi:S8 family serine peptidase [Carboxylicivirga sp. RSCT41]|uniref:S8 family serine peptidase n=1 Tax=Carboxylicivirga agarovorans TaxID=3417570 RepID=UPI003D326483